LIARALASFARRADIVRNSLKAPGYRIKEISINTNGGVVRPLLGARAFAAGAAPPVAAGTSRVVVRVSGAIELR
jgi:predicted secreted protein